MSAKYWFLIASYALAIFIGWHSHTWYDGYMANKTKDAIIDTRVEAEKNSNEDAAKTAHKEAENHGKARATDAQLEKHLNEGGDKLDCYVSPVVMRDLREAVTTHTRTRKPD